MRELYVLKNDELDVESGITSKSIAGDLGIHPGNLKVANRYIVENLSEEEFLDSVFKVFAEKNADTVLLDGKNLFNEDDVVIITEFLPGQFNIREDAARECLELVYEKFGLNVKAQKVYIFKNAALSLTEIEKIKNYLINPVEMREGSLSVRFDESSEDKSAPPVYKGFISFTDEELNTFIKDHSLAMNLNDLKVVREYFNKEYRDPSETEIKVLDTYWSDHCRHTTFNTILDDISFDDEDSIEYKTYLKYKELKKTLGRSEKPDSLMDLATIGSRYLQKTGKATDLDISEEINACSIKRMIGTANGDEEHLIMFKNETHNHPTEIEPFGGAATCLGGAIRDPLSGRSYVYQAMRFTGSADPTESTEKTLKGKLPQKKITTTAAKGYSSYGNQIGLAAGVVHEIYHPGYKAKRMEVGAVIGAAPAEFVIRKRPDAGDLILLIGGETGRDGIGGAVGSSRSHDVTSIEKSGAEVQKGNAPTERKIQRLFRKNKVKELILRCNDFGAGGVSVAVGELADGLDIDLSVVPTKYKGLNATETAISESQERMAVVIHEKDLNKFMGYLNEENLDGTVIAKVTEEKRLVMNWHGKTVCDLDREFLDSAGAKQYQAVQVTETNSDKNHKESDLTLDSAINEMLLDLNNQSQRGLNEYFDSTNGCATSILPFGGSYQDTESSYMAASIPLDKGISSDSSLMAYGFDPYLSENDQFKGAYMAVVESMAKIAASGAPIDNVRLSFQEYFEKLGSDKKKWGKPFKALLGALKAQLDLEVPAIGGKDSMSGTFEDISVPPTLISFAVNTEKTSKLLTNNLKGSGKLYLLKTKTEDESGKELPEKDSFKLNAAFIRTMNEKGLVSACDSTFKGLYMTLFNMSFGERTGFKLNESVIDLNGFEKSPADFIVATDMNGFRKDELVNYPGLKLIEIGSFDQTGIFEIGDTTMNIWDALEVNESRLGQIFSLNKSRGEAIDNITFNERTYKPYGGPVLESDPVALIVVMPGSNCEYDLERAFEKAGAKTNTFVLRNRNKEDLIWSSDELAKEIGKSQILVLPGGFSAGDEPDGSGKFIANVLRNEKIKAAVNDLTKVRDGLIIGICNGFQALIKTGLVPYGEIIEPKEDMPLLTNNKAGKHMDIIARVRIASVNSPWMKYVEVDEAYSVPISHGEGRFMASEKEMEKLLANGQVITQYCDMDDNATMDAPYNPNGSMNGVEGIVSPCGRILGKMGHNERWEDGLMRNYIDKFDMQIFKAGVDYFKKQ